MRLYLGATQTHRLSCFLAPHTLFKTFNLRLVSCPASQAGCTTPVAGLGCAVRQAEGKARRYPCCPRAGTMRGRWRRRCLRTMTLLVVPSRLSMTLGTVLTEVRSSGGLGAQVFAALGEVCLGMWEVQRLDD